MGDGADMALDNAWGDVEHFDRYEYSSQAVQYEEGLIDERGGYFGNPRSLPIPRRGSRTGYSGDLRGSRPYKKAKPGSELAQARIKAHNKFDILWKFGGMTRSSAYEWLADQMGYSKVKCHMGMFNRRQCKRVIEIIDEYLRRNSGQDKEKDTPDNSGTRISCIVNW